jgi:hypothetical protein
METEAAWNMTARNAVHFEDDMQYARAHSSMSIV